MKAAVVSHGEVDPGDAAHVRGADLVVAVDGGSAHCERWGITPHVVVGDLDSIDDAARERLERRGGRVERWPAEKDATDTELAVDRAIAEGADDVVLVGALGGPRIDHEIANTLLLARERAGRATIRLVRGPLTARAIGSGERLVLGGDEGEIVTLLAIGGDAHGVRTEGLRYPLHGETLRLGSSRGVSNEIATPPAAVSCGSGTLLVVHSSQGASFAGAEGPRTPAPPSTPVSSPGREPQAQP